MEHLIGTDKSLIIPGNNQDLFSNLKMSQDFEKFLNHLNQKKQRKFEFDRKDLLPIIGTFGTAGDSQWRIKLTGYYDLLMGQHSIEGDASSIIFNPQKGVGERKPEDAEIEATHLSDDGIIIFGLEKKYSSVGSMAEIGFLALFSALKNRKTISFIRESDKTLGENVSRARNMSMIDCEYIKSMIPSNFVFFNTEMSAMERAFWERVEFLNLLKSPINTKTIEILKPRNDIHNLVTISGTSNNKGSYQRNKILSDFDKFGIGYYDTIRDDWDMEIYEKEELKIKDTSKVNVVLITDFMSYGAVKDVGLSIFRAVMNGTYAIIYFPQDPDPKSDYQRARNLVMAHWNRLITQYPWVKNYVKFIDNYEEVIPYCYHITNTRKTKH